MTLNINSVRQRLAQKPTFRSFFHLVLCLFCALDLFMIYDEIELFEFMVEVSS